MNKIGSFFKKGILLLCLYIVCQFFVTGVFGVRLDDGGFIYAIAATILIVYLYGNKREK